MAAKKQPGKKSSPRTPAANPTRGRHEQDGVDPNFDGREMARKNLKPRSARQTLKGPNDRKASTSQKRGK